MGMTAILSAVAPAVGMGANGILGYMGQRETNKANRDMASSQMAFQERMSNTSHFREVEDLRAAGLNPILSANGGASSPSGASATMANAMEPLASSARDVPRVIQEMKLLKQQIKNAQQEYRESRARENKTYIDAEIGYENREQIMKQNRILETEAWNAENINAWRKKAPNYFGAVDTFGQSIGAIGNSSKSLLNLIPGRK